jgi:hypothetical protein
MYNSTLTQCLQAALLDGYSFAEITRIGAHNCPYSYGAHITLLVDKLFWQMKWHATQIILRILYLCTKASNIQ